MKKLTLFIVVACMLISMFAITSNAAAVEIPAEGSVTLDPNAAALTSIKGGQLKVEANGNFGYITALDEAKWEITVSKAGVYEAVTPICSNTGTGKVGCSINGVSQSVVNGFAAAGNWSTYTDHKLYFKVDEAGTYTFTLDFIESGANVKAPTISYYGEAFPEGTKVSLSPVRTDAETIYHSTAIVMGTGAGQYYAQHFTVSGAFQEIAFQSWCPNGGVTFTVEIYPYDEDWGDKNYGSNPGAFEYDEDPVSSTEEFSSNTNLYCVCTFDEPIPAGEYLLVLQVTETYDPTEAGSPQLWIGTGPILYEDEAENELYFQKWTNATNRNPQGRHLWFSLIAEAGAQFVESGTEFEDPTVTPEPTVEPTVAPTEAPTEAPTAAPTKAPAKEEEGGCGSSAVIAHVAMILAACVVLKKKR